MKEHLEGFENDVTHHDVEDRHASDIAALQLLEKTTQKVRKMPLRMCMCRVRGTQLILKRRLPPTFRFWRFSRHVRPCKLFCFMEDAPGLASRANLACPNAKGSLAAVNSVRSMADFGLFC